MEINLAAGFDVCRTLPTGQGIQSHHIHGFSLYMLSNHDADDTFDVRIIAHFVPDNRGNIRWQSLTMPQALRAITAVVEFSERNFGALALDDIDRELIADIESFLNQ